MKPMEQDDDDSMTDDVLGKMLGDTEGETDKQLFPEVSKDGQTVTITISTGAKPEEPKEEEPGDEDGGYASLMSGLSKE